MNPEPMAPTGMNEWQRLSPVAVIYFTIRFAWTSASQWFLNALPAIAAFVVIVNNKLFWLSILIPALALLLLTFSFLYYWFFRFQAGEGEILIQRGVVIKESINLRYARVQNINIGRPFYFSPFKVVNCVIESAGSNKTEVNLPGVSEGFALALRKAVFDADITVDQREADASVIDPGASKPLLKLSNLESAKSGLTSYVVLITMAAVAPFIESFRNYLAANVYPVLMDLIQPTIGNAMMGAMLLTVVTTLIILLLITSATVLAAFVRYYNFELYDSNDKLVQVAGLLERRTTTLQKAKVQSVLIRQNLMARLLKRISLQYQQVGFKQPKAKTAVPGSIHIPMLIPSEAPQMTSVVFPDCPEPEFSSIHPSYVNRVFRFYCVAPLIVILFFPVIFVSPFFLLALLVLAPAYALLRLRYHHYGIWSNGEFGAIRDGLFGHRIVIFPLCKVQKTMVRQSKGQKRRQLGNLKVQLGSGIVSIPYLPMHNVNRFIDTALFKTESSTLDWM